MNHRLSPTLALAALAFSACTMAPKYERPAAPVPGTFAVPAATANPGPASGQPSLPAAGTPAADLGWREFFSDPELQQLIEIALQQNRDLRVAVLNVESVAAQYRIQRAALFPTLTGNAGADRTKSPAALSFPGVPNPDTIYSLNAGISAWELDFFGRIRSLKAQALQLYLASAENRRAAQLALVAQVATEYLTERALDEEVAVAQQTLKSQEDSLYLSRRSYEVGATSELDFRTAQSQVATARSDLAALRRQHAQALTALAVLVGQPLPAAAQQPSYLADAGLVADLPAGLPADLLNRRPDILAAEHQLEAYNANIGAARAAFFPRITLTASGGLESLSLSSLFKSGSTAWAIDPQAVLPIFDAGVNLANLKIAKVAKLTAIAQYEKAVQTAFQEVSDGLTARALFEDQIAAQRDLVAADQGTYQLAEARYRQGVDSYLTALDAQRSLYAAQQGLIQSRLARLTNLVTLYQDLGGGWNEHTVTPPHGANPQ
jgi:multidrug efflux system outer membrane protein